MWWDVGWRLTGLTQTERRHNVPNQGAGARQRAGGALQQVRRVEWMHTSVFGLWRSCEDVVRVVVMPWCEIDWGGFEVGRMCWVCATGNRKNSVTVAEQNTIMTPFGLSSLCLLPAGTHTATATGAVATSGCATGRSVQYAIGVVWQAGGGGDEQGGLRRDLMGRVDWGPLVLVACYVCVVHFAGHIPHAWGDAVGPAVATSSCAGGKCGWCIIVASHGAAAYPLCSCARCVGVFLT